MVTTPGSIEKPCPGLDIHVQEQEGVWVVGVASGGFEGLSLVARARGQAQERAVDGQITRLRRKIEPDPKQPLYLQTVRGAGYMLAPD